MFGAISKTTNISFKKGMTFCCSIYVKNVMKLLAFIFEQPSYLAMNPGLYCLPKFTHLGVTRLQRVNADMMAGVIIPKIASKSSGGILR